MKESERIERTLMHYYNNGGGKERCLAQLETVCCSQWLKHLSTSEGPHAKIFIKYSK